MQQCFTNAFTNSFFYESVFTLILFLIKITYICNDFSTLYFLLYLTGLEDSRNRGRKKYQNRQLFVLLLTENILRVCTNSYNSDGGLLLLLVWPWCTLNSCENMSLNLKLEMFKCFQYMSEKILFLIGPIPFSDKFRGNCR